MGKDWSMKQYKKKLDEIKRQEREKRDRDRANTRKQSSRRKSRMPIRIRRQKQNKCSRPIQNQQSTQRKSRRLADTERRVPAIIIKLLSKKGPVHPSLRSVIPCRMAFQTLILLQCLSAHRAHKLGVFMDAFVVGKTLLRTKPLPTYWTLKGGLAMMTPKARFVVGLVRTIRALQRVFVVMILSYVAFYCVSVGADQSTLRTLVTDRSGHPDRLFC